MKRALIIRSLLVACAALVIAEIVSAFVLQQQYLDDRKAEMHELLNVMSVAENTSDYGALAKKLAKVAPDSLRVTFIAPDGKVLGDSDTDPMEMENHKSRAEVQAAMQTGYGEDIRHSETIGTDMLYAAKKLPDGTVVRLSANLKTLYDHVWSLLPGLLVGILLALAVTPFLAWRLSSGVVKPFGAVAASLESINGGGYGRDLPEPEYRELVPIVCQINELSHKIAGTLAELTTERKRIVYLLNNMNEGLVVLDRSQKILIANRSACAFFGAEENPEGNNLLCLTHIPRIVEASRNASENGNPEIFDFASDDESKILQLFVSPVTGGESGEADGGVILLVTDVTAVRRAEQIRSEFVANASHELKTPLTSIKGFAELMESGIITDPRKTSEYLALIRSETERMIVLINDILKLSELESIAEDTGRTRVSLLAVAHKVAASLSVQASEKKVRVTVSGDDGIVDANPDRMTQLALNLLDNAVKYNRSGGTVTVTVRQRTGNVVLTVADTGVGIPPEATDRVFERFYRVDKIRSRKMGGTGLGLSIVKHIVGLYKGKIDLKSKVGEGTTIEVTLPSANTDLAI